MLVDKLLLDKKTEFVKAITLDHKSLLILLTLLTNLMLFSYKHLTNY